MKTTVVDVADYLDTPEAIAAYLALSFEEGDAAEIRKALDTVARAKGMTSLERETGVSREALYKAFGDKGNPTLNTLLAVFKALGLRLAVTV